MSTDAGPSDEAHLSSKQLARTQKSIRLNISRKWQKVFGAMPIPRGVKGPTSYDMGMGLLLPEDLKGKIRLVNPAGDDIGRGGFGEVYKAIYKMSSFKKLEVAVKFLSIQKGTNMAQKTVQYLHRETLVWRRLNHRNILSFIGICSGLHPLNPVPALVSHYCSHGSVMSYLTKYPEKPRLPIVCQVAEGLQYLHANDIIHGDIKPDNILIDHEEVAVLCDFGRSRVIGVEGFTTHVATSAYFTAPELNTAEEEFRPVTMPADIFSFSVTLLLITTGRRPFHPTKGPAIAGWLNAGRRPNREPYEDCPEMSQEFWEIIEAGWNHDPSKRFNAHQILNALESLLLRRQAPTSP